MLLKEEKKEPRKISSQQLARLETIKPFIQQVLDMFTDNKDAPASIIYFRSDVYRYFFLLSFMIEYFEGSEISQEHAISLVPQRFASRIKRLQVLKHAVKLGYIIEESSNIDKRRRIYTPSELLVKDFLDGANKINSIFQN